MSDGGSLLIHATTVAIDGQAVLLRGFSGAGKSDLGLRLIDAGAELVADDQCELRREDDRIVVSCPETIAGLIELRGVGIVRMPFVAQAPLVLIIDLMRVEHIERMPTRRREMLLGLWVPAFALSPFDASAPVKLRMMLRALGGDESLSLLDPDDARARW